MDRALEMVLPHRPFGRVHAIEPITMGLLLRIGLIVIGS